MKANIPVIAAALLLAFGPATAKVDKEFPSTAIQPMVPQSEPSGPSTKEDNTPTTTAAEPASQACTTPTNSVETKDEGNRVACVPTKAAPAQSDIPQLRAFRQQSSQRFAP